MGYLPHLRYYFRIMGQHILSLFFPPVTNEGILLIQDTSTYDKLLQVTCPNLQITPPGYSIPASINPLNSEFNLTMNACTLGITPINSCAQFLPNLPDGIWNVRYSVSPNDYVWVDYIYMRTTKAMNRYIDLLCMLNMSACLPDTELQYILSQLDIIHNYIVSAKGTAEGCNHDAESGINQLRYANALMDKMSRCKPFC